jgi:hypothetical protein
MELTPISKIHGIIAIILLVCQLEVEGWLEGR